VITTLYTQSGKHIVPDDGLELLLRDDLKNMSLSCLIGTLGGYHFKSHIYLTIWKTDWKLANICPIFKKDDALDKTKYRYLSILQNICNVFVKILSI
jgi:hypothetical protein